jgi:hypothetical protein
VIADRDAAIAIGASALADAERRAGGLVRELRSREAAVARSRARVEELEHVATRLAERVVERDQELLAVRAEIAAVRARGDEGVRTLAVLAEELQAVRRQARAQATRMRLRALRDAAELTRRIERLGAGSDGAGERLTTSVEEAIERIAAGEEEPDDPLEMVPADPLEREPGELFEGLVEVEVGPLSDFSQLVGFEDAAAGIGATSEVSVKRFAQGRATLAMRFKHPVELLAELEERSPFEFHVRDTRADRVVLDLGE